MVSRATALYNLPLYNKGDLCFFANIFERVDFPTDAGPSIAIIFTINI